MALACSWLSIEMCLDYEHAHSKGNCLACHWFRSYPRKFFNRVRNPVGLKFRFIFGSFSCIYSIYSCTNQAAHRTVRVWFRSLTQDGSYPADRRSKPQGAPEKCWSILVRVFGYVLDYLSCHPGCLF